MSSSPVSATGVPVPQKKEVETKPAANDHHDPNQDLLFIESERWHMYRFGTDLASTLPAL
jgi:hypothetical protein